MHAHLLQSCPTLFDPMDYSLPGSSVHGFPLARILQSVAMPSLQGIVATQRSNLHLLHWQTDSLPTEPLGEDPIKIRPHQISQY